MQGSHIHRLRNALTQVKSPLAIAIAEHLNAEGGSSSGVGFSQSEEMTASGFEILPDAEAPAEDLARDTDVDTAPSEVVPITHTPLLPAPEGQTPAAPRVRAPMTLGGPQISAMALLRTSFMSSVENERVRLLMVERDLGKSVGKLRKTLTEQRQRLTVMERKAVEKSRSHDRAQAQFRRAREIMNANKVDIGSAGPKRGASPGNSGVRMSELLVNSWMDNVAVAAKQVESWEVKINLQKERLENTMWELASAEDVLREKVEVLDESLTHLHALAGFLATL